VTSLAYTNKLPASGNKSTKKGADLFLEFSQNE
jgi:hypothetical protein